MIALIVEDEPMIALDLEAALLDMGFDTVEIALSVDQALEGLAKARFDLVLIDYKLGEQTAEPVIEALAGARTPHIIVTGYDERALPASLPGAPILNKPVTPAMLRETIARLALR